MKSVAVSAERSVHGRRRRQCWLQTSGLDLVLAARRRLGGHGGAQQLDLGLGLLLERLELVVRLLVRRLHDGPWQLRSWPPRPSEGTFLTLLGRLPTQRLLSPCPCNGPAY